MDILEDLRRDHDEIRLLLEELAASSELSPAQRAKNLSLLHEHLATHADLETRHFGPLFARRSDLGLAEKVRDAHVIVDRLFGELAAIEVEHAEWLARLAVLKAAIEEHIHGTEADVFPLVVEVLGWGGEEGAVAALASAPRPVERRASRKRPKRIRYAVVGLGHIAQVAVLPAFAHARKNSSLAALVSDDPKKLAKLGRKYEVELCKSYDEYDELLHSGEIDAVYVALPNDMHRDYTLRAAAAGVHVLCEKPLATTSEDCVAMIRAARAQGVKLMTAYRLHFDRANMRAVDVLEGGRIGEPRYFHSLFSMQVRDEENIRLAGERGGGPLLDLGIYCINAARYLFRAEPEEVTGMAENGRDERFAEVQEMFAATLRFPGGRLASFTCSFGASDASMYRVVGTKGSLEMEPAYEYAEGLKQRVTVGKRTTLKAFPKRDQFAPELLHFSECVLEGRDPEPSGLEGLADVRVIDALQESARTGRSVRLAEFEKELRPSSAQARSIPPVRKPEEIHARPPSD